MLGYKLVGISQGERKQNGYDINTMNLYEKMCCEARKHWVIGLEESESMRKCGAESCMARENVERGTEGEMSRENMEL